MVSRGTCSRLDVSCFAGCCGLACSGGSGRLCATDCISGTGHPEDQLVRQPAVEGLPEILFQTCASMVWQLVQAELLMLCYAAEYRR